MVLVFGGMGSFICTAGTADEGTASGWREGCMAAEFGGVELVDGLKMVVFSGNDATTGFDLNLDGDTGLVGAEFDVMGASG